MAACSEALDLASNFKLAHMLARAASVMIWIADTTKACVYFNDAWLRFRGRTLQQEYGFGWADGVHPDEFDRCLKIYTEAFDARQPFVMEYRLMTADGTFRWIRDEGEPYWNESQEFEGYIGSCYDIDELKRTQEVSRAAIWSYDVATNAVWWSPGLFRIFGLPVSEKPPCFETQKSLFTPEAWAILEPAFVNAIEHGEGYELELELASHGAEKRFAISTCEPQLNTNGNVMRLVGMFRDVSALSKARSEAEEVAQRLSLAKAAAGIGVWEWDLASGEIFWDDRMRQIYGFESGPILYENWRRMVHPEDLSSAELMLTRAQSGATAFNTTFRIVRNGEIRHILALSQTVGDQMFGVNLDISEVVRMREEVRRINDLESLGVLAGGIAHDFNNQLTNIRARADLIALRAGDAAFVEQAAEQLGRAVEAANGLTTQLLTFSKGGTLVQQSASMEALVRENIEFCLRGAAVEVVYDVASDLCPANVDTQRIGQVIQNIVINASQAMGSRGGKLTVSMSNRTITKARPALDRGQYVELCFEDNGPGMSADVCDRIFDPFYTTKSNGHGLGLAICHSIVSQHGGCIEASTREGHGTAITIQLPAAEGDAQQQQEVKTVIHGKGKVLIVDDMPDVLASMIDLVQALGYDCAPADSPQQAESVFAQALAEDHGFNVVITDLTMPGTGGALEVLEKLRAIDPKVKIILLSGYANDPAAEDEAMQSFDARLSKPCSLADLSVNLERLLGKT